MAKDEEPLPETDAPDAEPGHGGPGDDDTLSGRSRVLKFATRLMAREFRSYLKELKLKEDLLKLATSHSLEISVHLKPLATAAKDDPTEEGE